MRTRRERGPNACRNAAPPVGRPGDPPQGLGKIESAPGSWQTPAVAAVAEAARDLSGARSRREGGPNACANAAPPVGRPGIPPQSLEKIESAPGISSTPAAVAVADAARDLSRAPSRREPWPGACANANAAPPVGRPYLPRRCGLSHEPRPEEPAIPGLRSGEASRKTFQRALERPSRRDACGAAPQDEVGAEGSARLGSHGRPGNPPQSVEKIESAPGISSTLAVAAATDPARDLGGARRVASMSPTRSAQNGNGERIDRSRHGFATKLAWSWRRSRARLASARLTASARSQDGLAGDLPSGLFGRQRRNPLPGAADAGGSARE